VAALPHCSVYGPGLVDSDNSSDVSATGGTVVTAGSGGQPGSGSGGSQISTGGQSLGGAATGGQAPTDNTVLIDDLEHAGDPGYNNDPYFGSWFRVDDGSVGSAWTSADVGGMVELRSSSPDNYAMHVSGTGFADWGIDVYLTLQDTGVASSVDLSAYTGIAFTGKADSTTKTVKVALADEYSHDPNCMDVDAGANCNKHATAVPASLFTTSWKEFKVPFSKVERTPAVDLTQVFAIHFTMDPDAVGNVDFWIDDVRLYK
jgi:hypothetical protein